MPTKNLRGYTVFYEDNAAKGVEHLAYVLSPGEADSLFYSARLSRKIKFEDRVGRNYILISKLNGTFEVRKRRGWW